MSALEVLLGAILSIIITIVVEAQRKPHLKVTIALAGDNAYTERHPARRGRFLYVGVENSPLPGLFRWLARNAALQTSAHITFFHLDGQPVFAGPMLGRWSRSPEPVAPIAIAGKGVSIENITFTYDFSAPIHTRMDIYPGNSEPLDIAARFDEDDACYGWNNEAYFSQPSWRNPKWKLPPGRYLVRVDVSTSGEKTSALFRLCNDVGIDDFRLEPPVRSDALVPAKRH